MQKCIKCGGDKWQITADVGALETVKCVSCGHEETAHTLSSSDLDDPRKGEQFFKLTFKLNKSISREQIDSLRGIFRVFELKSFVDIRKAAIANEVVELGSYPDTEVMDLKSKVETLGLGENLNIGAGEI